MDLEAERKSGASYFSWLVDDLTKWYLPLFLCSVNSRQWTQPLEMLEEPIETRLINPNNIFLITNQHLVQNLHVNLDDPISWEG